MIKGITGGRNLIVTGGSTSAPYINTYSNQLGVGNLRFNSSTQNIEVFDGNGWIAMSSSYAQVELTPEVNEILDWARQERQQQREYAELAKKHPGIADAMESVKDAKLKLRELAILCQESET